MERRMIFMIHPEHGATHVRTNDVEEHKKNGWKVSSHAEWLSKKISHKKPDINTKDFQKLARRG
jgi:hypothetical protein